MFNLIWGYLLIITILFSANIGLFLGNIKLNNLKSTLIFILLGIVFFMVIFISSSFKVISLDYLNYIFILIAAIIFVLLVFYLKTANWKNSLLLTIILFYVSSFLLACQTDDFSIFDSSLVSVVSIIFMIIAFQFSKLLKYAKRPYDVIIGEYMSLEGILIFIFGLTFTSIMQLDYSMFSSFLILTPTYQLIYVIIGIIFVLIIGFYWNDKNNLR